MTDCYPKRAPNLASRVFEGEVIIMNPADSSLFNLNESGSAIWLAADGKTSLRQIVERELVPVFDVDAEEALREAGEFVQSLAEQSILVLLPDADAET